MFHISIFPLCTCSSAELLLHCLHHLFHCLAEKGGGLLGDSVLWQASEKIMRKVQPPPGSSALCELLPLSLTGVTKKQQLASIWKCWCRINYISRLIFLYAWLQGEGMPPICLLTSTHRSSVAAGHTPKLWEQCFFLDLSRQISKSAKDWMQNINSDEVFMGCFGRLLWQPPVSELSYGLAANNHILLWLYLFFSACWKTLVFSPCVVLSCLEDGQVVSPHKLLKIPKRMQSQNTHCAVWDAIYSSDT